MPAQTPTARLARTCGHCDGFPVVHIATGSRLEDGTLPTLAVACPVCRGTGRARAVRPVTAPVAR